LAQEGDAFALLHVAIEMTGEDSPDGLRSQRKACGVGAQYRDAGDALSKATKGGLALIQRIPAAGEQRGEHPGAGTHVDIASRRELGEGAPDLFTFRSNDLGIDLDAQAGEVGLSARHSAVVVGRTSVVVRPKGRPAGGR